MVDRRGAGLAVLAVWAARGGRPRTALEEKQRKPKRRQRREREARCLKKTSERQ